MTTALLLSLVAAAVGQAAVAAPRDGQAAAATGAAISGSVVSDDAQPMPVRRARIAIASSDGTVAHETVTDDGGRFSVESLAAGHYRVAVSKDGWIATAFGAKRPLGPGLPLALAANERAHIAIRLLHGAAITGRLVDPHGLPAAGAAVRALRVATRRGERVLENAGAPASADDRGLYRIYGLPPGEYVVRARWRPEYFGTDASELRLASDVDVRSARAGEGGPRSADPQDRAVALAPTFFPGTTVPAEATTVTVGGGEERAGVDFRLQIVSTARLEGTVIAADGRPVPAGLSVNLMAAPTAAPADRPIDVHRDTLVRPDGSFAFVDVAPGRYALFTRAALSGAGGPIVWASTDVAVEGDSISGLDLVLRAGTTLSGRVQFDGQAPPVDVKTVRVHLVPEDVENGVHVAPASATVDTEGRFTVQGIVPGRYRLSASFPGVGRPGGWFLRSTSVGAADALDRAVTIQPGRNVIDAVVEFADSMAELTGAVMGAAATTAPPSFVILFPRDSALWTASSRRIRATSPSTDGAFAFHGLPGGEYLLAAVDDVEPGEWTDPTFLERLAREALTVRLSGTERAVQNIQMPPRR